MSGRDTAYGNTRLRARREKLLSRAATEALIGRDLDGVLGALGATAYRPALETALARGGGLPALQAAIRERQAAELRLVRSLYDGADGSAVGVLLSRVDRANLLVLLRGHARGLVGDALLALTVPAGAFDESALREAAAQPEIESLVRLLAAWKLPDAQTARALRVGVSAYEMHQDLAALEAAAIAAHATAQLEIIQRSGRAAMPVAQELAQLADDANLLAVVRSRAARERGEPLPGVVWVPGGDATPTVIAERAAGVGERPVELQERLEVARLRHAMALFGLGDPLSLAIPLAYVASLEAEARNLRLIGAAAERGIAGPELRGQLVLAA